MPGPVIRPPIPISLARERLRILVYGDPKVGKTTLALTAPRPVVINTDDGLVSVAVQGATGLEFRPTGYKEMEGIFWWCKENAGEYDTIVVDDLTTLQRLLIDEIHDAGLAAGKQGKPVMQFVPEQGEYLANQGQVARILTDLRRLGKHMIVIAGVRERLGKRSPDVSPGLTSIVTHWASVIGELDKITHNPKTGEELDTPRRLLRTSGSNREAGSRFRSLEPHVWDPTFEKLWDAVTKEYAEAEAKSQATVRKESA
jgi:hypothetical protein